MPDLFKDIMDIRKKTTQQAVTYMSLKGLKRDQIIEDVYNNYGYYNFLRESDFKLPSHEIANKIINFMKDLIDEFCRLNENEKQILSIIQEYYPEEDIYFKTTQRTSFFRNLLQDLKHEINFTSSFEENIQLSLSTELSIQKGIFNIILNEIFMKPEVYEQIEKIEDLYFKFNIEYKPGNKIREYTYNKINSNNKKLEKEQFTLANIKALIKYIFGLALSKEDLELNKYNHIYHKLLASVISNMITSIEKDLYDYEINKLEEFELDSELRKKVRNFDIVAKFNNIETIGFSILEQIEQKVIYYSTEKLLYFTLERDIKYFTERLNITKEIVKTQLNKIIEKYLDQK